MTRADAIADRVAALHAQRAGRSRNEVMATFAREQAELAAAGPPAGVAAVGARVPNVALLDAHGARTDLVTEVGQPAGVLVFYRGAWCPYCNLALATYQSELLPVLRERGVALIAISPQKPDGSLSMQEANDLTFSVLSDPANLLARHLGIVTGPSVQARAAQLQLGLDLEAVNADATIAVPMPTVAIIDGDRILRWIDVHPDYSTRSEPDQVIQALDDLGL